MNVTHTWVGDLILGLLEHVDTGSTAVLFDRPGVPPGTFGCSGDNIDNYADDEATPRSRTTAPMPIRPMFLTIPTSPTARWRSSTARTWQATGR